MAFLKFKNLVDPLGSSILVDEISNIKFQRTVILVISFLISIFIYWASTTTLHEISSTEGHLVPKNGVVPIQHRFGGQVFKLFVKDGEKVKEGDVVAQLKDGTTISDLKRAKLKLQSAINSKKYFDREFNNREKLYKRGLESEINYYNMSSKKSNLQGEIEDLQEIVNNLEEQILNFDVKAPILGYVHALEITPGAVIVPGSTIMEIVPIEEEMLAEIEISPTDIGHVKPGQTVSIKFDSFDFSKYGIAEGTLEEVSPTTFEGPEGDPHYRGYVSISKTNPPKFGPLLPGMTIKADIHTGSKTIMEYLLKPLYSSASEALRER